MTGKQRDRGRGWQPLVQTQRRVNPKLAAAAQTDLSIARETRIHMAKEFWTNNLYAVTVTRGGAEGVTCLSISRIDRRPANDWRHLQRIKNELAGPETEAMNIHPKESRLVDTANQTFLWCLPPGMDIPFGFGNRLVQGPGEGPDTGQVQRPFEEGVSWDEH